MRTSPFLVVLLLGIVPPAFAGFKACLQGCNAKGSTVDCCSLLGDGLSQACADYKLDLSDIRSAYQDCTSTDHQKCRPTGDGGGCRILLEGCFRPCADKRDRKVAKARAKLARAINGSVDASCKVKGGRARRLAAAICTSRSHCNVGLATTSTTTSTTTTVPTTASTLGTTPTTTATATTTPTTTTHPPTTTSTPIGNEGDFDPCLKGCLNRIDSLKSCYERCDDNCERNRDALKACRQGCRNVRCVAIAARCTTGTPDTDPIYNTCCDPDGLDGPLCLTRGDIADICETTTSTTSTSTTTVSTVTTTSVTTTTLLGTG